MMIFFDVDDTLYNLMSSFQRTHEELFQSRIDTPCETLFLTSRKYNKEAFDLWNKGLISKKEEFNYRIRKTYEEFGLSLTEEELDEFRKKYRQYQDEIRVADGIDTLLDLLIADEIPLGVITNGNHDDQWKKIKALQVEHWIPTERIFVSEDLPAPKPELPAYRFIEARLGIDPAKEEIWYIGDTFEADILGAQNAGWKSIWFNHRHKPLPQGAAPADLEVHTVAELLAWGYSLVP